MMRTTENEDLMLEGLRRSLMEATSHLYKVFTSFDHAEDREEKFLRGAERHRADYERMVALVTGEKT